MPYATYRLYDGVKNERLEHLTDPGDWGSEEEAQTLTALAAYACVPYLYRAVQLRSLAIANMPWSLTPCSRAVGQSGSWAVGESLRRAVGESGSRAGRRDDSSTEGRDDPTTEGRDDSSTEGRDDSMTAGLTDYPHLMRGMRMRLYATEADLCLYGAAYWLKETNRFRRSLSPRRVVPTSIQPCYDTYQGLVGFERYIGSRAQWLRPEDLVYIWQPALRAETGPGLAPACVALRAAGVLHHLDRFAEGFFQRGAIKATLLSVEGNPARGELDRLEHWWRRLVSGVRHAWESVAIRSTVKPVVIGEGLEALANETLTMQRREDVCAALGVPHSLISADAANYATSQQDKITFLTGTVLPESELIAEALNEQLFHPLGLHFQFNPAQLEELQQYEMLKAQALFQLTGRPILTVDEARAMLGLPALKDEGRTTNDG